MSYDVFHVFTIFHPSLREIRLIGFVIFDISIIGYFGLVFNLAVPTCNNFYTYIFLLESEIENRELLTFWYTEQHAKFSTRNRMNNSTFPFNYTMFFRLIPDDTVHLSHSGVPPQLWAQYQGVAEAGDEPDYEMVGLGR